MTLLKLIVSLAILYLVWKLFRLLFFYFSEYLVLWVVANGGNANRRSISAKMRMHFYMCPTELMDEESVIEMFKFLNNQVDHSLDIKEFHKVLLSYTYAVLFRERRDGSLRGLFLLSLDKVKDNNMSYTVLKPGLSFFEKEYRGGPYFYYIFAYLCIREFILHPLTPFYMFGKAFSYRSYATATHTVSHVYPSYNRKTPDHIKNLIDEYANKTRLPGEEYDSERCVLKRERSHMRSFVSEASRVDTNDPNVKFFIDTNPGWEKGHQLLTLSVVQLRDIFRVIYRIFIKGGQRKGKPRRERRNTFQLDSANLWSKKVLEECDIHDHEDHHPVVFKDDSMQDLNTLLS